MPLQLLGRIAAERHRGFVGRAEPLGLFGSMLAGDGGVLFVHGPGGIGKTSLLRQFRWVAEQRAERAAGPVLWLDGREVAGDPAAVLAALRAAAGPGADPFEPPATRTGAPVVLIDNVDRLAPLDRWLREELLPRFPANVVAVLAGRERPTVAWRTDPGWHGVLRVLRLPALDPAEARELLAKRGVPAAEHGPALEFTRGHPLALALVADLGTTPVPAAAAAGGTGPEVVSALLDGLLDAVPGPLHRAALEACALVRVSTEPLLAALLEVPDAGELFGWLRGLSMVEHGPRGVFPHDLARDALAAELRWRHPDRYAAYHRRAGAYYQRSMAGTDPAGQHEVLLDFAFLHRASPVLGPFLSGLAPGGAGSLERAAAGEHEALQALVARHEGAESGALAAHWLRRQPDGTRVVRAADGGIAGFCTVLVLTGMSPADRELDPAVAVALGYLERHAPLRGGEMATMARFWMAADTYQAPSPVQTVLGVHLSQQYLSSPSPAFSFQPFADPERWAGACGYLDLHRLPAADFAVGGRRYGVYGHDWRAVPPLAWLELLAERETAAAPLAVPSPAGRAPRLVLDQEAFGAAVRDALRELGRPDRLHGSPLLGSRVVSSRLAGAAGGTGEDVDAAAAALVAAIRAAAAKLEASPRDVRGFRALHHTYLAPAGTQERAADLLGLPMSTFRRHLAAGVSQLVDILWRQELD